MENIEFQIAYKGSTPKDPEKFLLFVMSQGREILFASLGYTGEPEYVTMPYTRIGIIQYHNYNIPYEYIKIFLRRKAHPVSGIKPFYSFYMKLSNERFFNSVTIAHPDNHSLMFRAKGKFLSTAEAVAILAPESARYVQAQQRPSKEELRSMITIEKPSLVSKHGRKLIIRKR